MIISMYKSPILAPAKKQTNKENLSPHRNVLRLAAYQNKTNASFTVCGIYTSKVVGPFQGNTNQQG